MAHISSGVSGSLFFWRLAHFFLDNRNLERKYDIDVYDPYSSHDKVPQNKKYISEKVGCFAVLESFFG